MLNICYLTAGRSDWIAEYRLERQKSLRICTSGSTGGCSSNQGAPPEIYSESYHTVQKNDEIAEVTFIDYLLLTLYSLLSLPGPHLDHQSRAVCN